MFFFILNWILSAVAAVISGVYNPFGYPNGIWLPIVVFFGGFLVLCILYLAVMYLISLCYRKKEYKELDPVSNWLFREFFQVATIVFFTKVKVIGKEKLPKEKFLLVYNHTTCFDAFYITHILGKEHLVQVSKPENLKLPIAGTFAIRNLYLPINRENPREAIKTLNKASDFISSQRFSVAISPEGTRNKNPENGLLPFKDGALKIAYYAKCPIVVVGIEKGYRITHKFIFKPLKVNVKILDVIKYDDFKDIRTPQLADIVIKDMNEYLYKDNKNTGEEK